MGLVGDPAVFRAPLSVCHTVRSSFSDALLPDSVLLSPCLPTSLDPAPPLPDWLHPGFLLLPLLSFSHCPYVSPPPQLISWLSLYTLLCSFSLYTVASFFVTATVSISAALSANRPYACSPHGPFITTVTPPPMAPVCFTVLVLLRHYSQAL